MAKRTTTKNKSLRRDDDSRATFGSFEEAVQKSGRYNIEFELERCTP